MSAEQLDPDAYACAVGSAILAFNTAEMELAELLQQLGHGCEVEGMWFSGKLEALEQAAAQPTEAPRSRIVTGWNPKVANLPPRPLPAARGTPPARRCRRCAVV